MKYQLIDAILEQTPDRIVAIKQVSLAEEYLGDHFPGYPVLPGVLMLETMVQAARTMLADRGDRRLVLGGVKALKYGSMVRPGQTLRVEVSVMKETPEGGYQCRGTGSVHDNCEGDDASGETAVAGRFTMRPIRAAASCSAGEGAA
jgi:3-hydroxyacyl-[acyl-carrier-protein] dehydratase